MSRLDSKFPSDGHKGKEGDEKWEGNIGISDSEDEVARR